jgi:Ca2+-binding EF-hand superfamily protein
MTKSRMTTLAAIVIAGLVGARALVSSPKQDLMPGLKQTVQLLVMMPTDENGKVSKAEFMKFMEAEFDKLDKNHDGALDVKEVVQSQDKQPKETTQSAYYVHGGVHR